MDRVIQFTPADNLQGFCVVLRNMGIEYTLAGSGGVMLHHKDLARVYRDRPGVLEGKEYKVFPEGRSGGSRILTREEVLANIRRRLESKGGDTLC